MRPFGNHPDELLSASLTGELTSLERRELDAHLAACAECRETLEAFSQQRQLLAGMSEIQVPRDLGARVRAGIESGRFSTPWYRRPTGMLAGAASLATVAVAALLAIVLLNRPGPPQIGVHSATPTTSPVASLTPPSASETPAPSTRAGLPLDAKPGDLLYLSVTGDQTARRLEVIADATGKSMDPANPAQPGWGQPYRASLSPDGRLLAFATLLDGKGSWLLFVNDLASGRTVQLGETLPQAFGRRLLWSPDGRYLAFTISPPPDVPGSGMSDVWLYDRTTGEHQQLTKSGVAYAASWAPLVDGQETLWISLAAENPESVSVHFPASAGLPSGDPLSSGVGDKAPGVFLPLLAPDGQKAIFWRGTMSYGNADTGWIFKAGGLPQLTTSGAGGIPSWNSASPLFDLQLTESGAAFASGDAAWAGDSDTFAFWGGDWNGSPQGDGYPDRNAVYAGKVSAGQLTKDSALQLGDMTTADGHQLGVVDVALSPDGTTAGVTLVYPSPETVFAAYLRLTPASGAAGPKDVGGGAGLKTPPWLGPAAWVPLTATP